ncbi:hypothetical protein GWK83_14340, partial [Yersinia pestis]|nr:hypothetical protein [Yersinia pestis]NWN54533.1 hypothetical protein [Yersinia pestis]
MTGDRRLPSLRCRNRQRGHKRALNPKTWTSALLLFYLSPVFCRTHSACFQANALCIV